MGTAQLSINIQNNIPQRNHKLKEWAPGTIGAIMVSTNYVQIIAARIHLQTSTQLLRRRLIARGRVSRIVVHRAPSIVRIVVQLRNVVKIAGPLLRATGACYRCESLSSWYAGPPRRAGSPPASAEQRAKRPPSDLPPCCSALQP